MSELATHGYMESDAAITDRLKTLPIEICAPQAKPPHIILVHDESSFDIRAVPGVKVPADYGGYFRSFDGKRRHFIVEGAGGPSWYSEYNVLAGLSARSFGRFAYYVTQIAAGRVERGLPAALRRCGYRTFSIYPALGAFMSARNFQITLRELGPRETKNAFALVEARACRRPIACRRAELRRGANRPACWA